MKFKKICLIFLCTLLLAEQPMEASWWSAITQSAQSVVSRCWNYTRSSWTSLMGWGTSALGAASILVWYKKKKQNNSFSHKIPLSLDESPNPSLIQSSENRIQKIDIKATPSEVFAPFTTIVDSWSPAENLHVVQPRVVNQMTEDGGGGASCGYQASNNALKIYQLLHRRRDTQPSSLENVDDVLLKFGKASGMNHGYLRQLICNFRIENALMTYLINNMLNTPPEWDNQPKIKSCITSLYDNCIREVLRPIIGNMLDSRQESFVMPDLRNIVERTIDEPHVKNYAKQEKLSEQECQTLLNFLKSPDVLFCIDQQKFPVVELSMIPDAINYYKNKIGLAVGNDDYSRGEWITNEEIYKIIKKQRKMTNITKRAFPYSIISSIEDIAPDRAEIYEDDHRKIDELREKIASNQPFHHAFIMGTMSSEARSSGHWINVNVENNKGIQTYYVCDSNANHARVKDNIVKRLIYRLHRPIKAQLNPVVFNDTYLGKLPRELRNELNEMWSINNLVDQEKRLQQIQKSFGDEEMLKKKHDKEYMLKLQAEFGGSSNEQHESQNVCNLI